MKKIPLTIILLFLAFQSKAQLSVNQDFESISTGSLPSGWTTEMFLGILPLSEVKSKTTIDDQCTGSKVVQTNLNNMTPSSYIMTETYSNCTTDAVELSFGLKIRKYGVNEFTTTNYWVLKSYYSIDNGGSWTALGQINNSNFSPSLDCQTITYNIPEGILSESSQFKFKLEYTVSQSIPSSEDYVVLFDDFTITQQSGASVSNFENSKVEVYPNPVSDVINISYEDEIKSVSVFDLSGRLVKKQGNSKTINVTDLNSGIYIVNVETSLKTSTFKIVKK